MTKHLTRRGLIKTGAVAGAGLALPTIFTSRASAYVNEPKGDTVTLGFNVPQTGPYATRAWTSCVPSSWRSSI
jgi:hypothetical protein